MREYGDTDQVWEHIRHLEMRVGRLEAIGIPPRRWGKVVAIVAIHTLACVGVVGYFLCRVSGR